MAAIEALVLAAAVIVAGVVLILAVVIIGIHQEERRGTLARENAPSGLALLTRRMLGAHFCLGAEEGRAKAGVTEDRSQGTFAPANFESTDQTGKTGVLAGH